MAEDEVCSFCRLSLRYGEIISVHSGHFHGFHLECLISYFNHKKDLTCILCRKPYDRGSILKIIEGIFRGEPYKALELAVELGQMDLVILKSLNTFLIYLVLMLHQRVILDSTLHAMMVIWI